MNKTVKKYSDNELGMNCKISRRDILHGIGALSAGALTAGPLSLFSGSASADEKALPLAQQSALSNKPYYPPASTGLRGNHAGSFEVAHQLGRENKRDWGKVVDADETLYDLVIVGAGISGLSAAHFYQKKHPDAKILLLDNHDDFGGHAKRNEFKVGEHTLIGYGGAQTLQEPSSYSNVVKGLLDDLGVEIKRFDKAYDKSFYHRNKLTAGIHFSKERWGVDRVVPIELGVFSSYLPLAQSALSKSEAVEKMPISASAKIEFVRLLTEENDQISQIKLEDKKRYLKSISYRQFLQQHMHITEVEVFEILQDLVIDYGAGIDAINAYSALSYGGLPGWGGTGLVVEKSGMEEYIHHFPDGNASIARLLIRKMIPSVATGNTMEDIVTAKFDYSKLDQQSSPVRMRLNSTVVNVEHQGEVNSAENVKVSYIQAGTAYRVQAKNCVLACNNSIIPYLCPQLPETQRQALDFQEKTPILYTTVALKNWQAWKKLNIGAVVSPGAYFINALIDFPVSIGDYKYAQSADEPMIVHMERFPHVNNQGMNVREQHRHGRHELMTTTFATIERNVRTQLMSLLGEYGFDPARDIADITVNRWAHGYAYGYRPLFDPIYEDKNDKRYPHIIARQPFGKITIANADSGAKAMMECAVEQAYRAVNELNTKNS
ncbi:NAD(P)/FAD-dependent oxidoreductase [Thalassotalea psychrophila]|uniref:NAD(P)/FAD-dependent oxidoreductase n=1 Tax=Thalassotalea psychrophila TaxID=3065647 RepID=A0ABY9TT30_9GAMM|nr:NAD(P)/FAD-dependent oxidoreductase [Colwelliaceae bacterium SQ149]